MPTTEEYQAWLTKAEESLNKLMTGTKTAEVTYFGRTVKYSQTNVGDLRAYIRELEVKLGLRSGRTKAILTRF